MRQRIGCVRGVEPRGSRFTSVSSVRLLSLGALVFCVCLVSALRAETVALWKLDYEGDGSALNTRCLLNPAYDLGLNGSAWVGTAVESWVALPPNPDTTGGYLASPTNRNAVGLNLSSSCFTNIAVSARVNVTNSFTVEGWVYRITNPTGTGWHYLVGNHMGGAGRWILSLRQGGTNWVLYVDSRVNDIAFPVKNDPSTTNVWRHIALTYKRDAGSSQQGVWELFVDAQSCGALTNSSRPTAITTADSVFSLGGRPSGGNTGTLKLDYWRISDAVLAPAAFLNAGTSVPAAEPPSRTLAYWRLDGTADGRLDTRDFVGSARLSSMLDVTNHTTVIQASAVNAFNGQPPNSALTLPSGNTGSLYAQGSGACLRVNDLGRQLEITNSFTVEGWLCPQRRDYQSDLQYIANTRIATKGWAFALKKLTDGTRKLVIFAADDAGTIAGDEPVSGDLEQWADVWRHVALVYDHTAGAQEQGGWKCYLDGVLQGSYTHTRTRSGTTSSEYFHLGGRVSNANTFCGGLDCWRVSRAALSPQQFLNASADAQPAVGVLALWPLNSSDGLYLDATDVTGGWPFHTPLTALHKVTASVGHAAATVPNPDRSAVFRGDPATNCGSVVFNTPAAGAARAYLATTDSTLRDMLSLTNSFTWEAWLCRTQNPGAWQLLFGTGTSPNFVSGGMDVNLTYRSNGYVLWVSQGGISDVALGGTADDGTLGVWRHVALVYDVSLGKGTWKFYVNGLLQGTLENSTQPVRTLPGGIYIGGRPWSANSFNGAIDSVRLTKGALAPSQFLNAASVPPERTAPVTVAYWKLDSDGTVLDASSQVEPRYSFIADGFRPDGSTEQFRPFVPSPDTSAGFLGDARANAGSAAFTNDYLRIQNLGARAELDRAFTVEGWLYWKGGADGQAQTLAATRFDTGYGWRLTLARQGGSAEFHLTCRTPTQTVLADDPFPADAAGLLVGWHHVALVYTPRREDTGTWELFVDGVSAGTVANRYYPALAHQSHWFALGGQLGGTYPFNGYLDCWRLSDGALTPAEFLYLGFSRATLIQVR